MEPYYFRLSEILKAFTTSPVFEIGKSNDGLLLTKIELKNQGVLCTFLRRNGNTEIIRLIPWYKIEFLDYRKKGSGLKAA